MAKHLLLHAHPHYTCGHTNCYYITNSSSNLKAHKRISHGGIESRLSCPHEDCNYTTSNVSNYKRHQTEKHRQYIPLVRSAEPKNEIMHDVEFDVFLPEVPPEVPKEAIPTEDISNMQQLRIRSYLNEILHKSRHKFPESVRFEFLEEEVNLIGSDASADKFLGMVMDVSSNSLRDAIEANNAAMDLISNRSGPRFLWIKGLAARLSGWSLDKIQSMSILFTDTLTKRCFPLNSDHEAAASHAHLKADFDDPEQLGRRMKYGKSYELMSGCSVGKKTNLHVVSVFTHPIFNDAATENLTGRRAESLRHQILSFTFNSLWFWPVTATLRPFLTNFISSFDRALQTWILSENDALDEAKGSWKALPETLLATYPGCLEQREHLDEPWRVEGQPYTDNPKALAREYQNFSIWFPLSLRRRFVMFIDKDNELARNGGKSDSNKKIYLEIPVGDAIYFSTFIRHAGAPASPEDTAAKQLNFGIHRYVDFVTGRLAIDRTRTKTKVGIDLDI
jgi:hypothetical protein